MNSVRSSMFALARGLRSPYSRPHRWLTAKWGLRARPDFLIIGAQKAGTTSLYEYLAAHPQVRAPLQKEVHFFDNHLDRGFPWYLSHFPLSGRKRHEWQTFEASPYYLYHPAVPARVRQVLPDVRLVVILRDPVMRALSHYQHERRRGRETRTFAEAIALETERLTARAPAVRARNDQFFSYVARGRYAEQVARWFEHFPRESFIFLRTEELAANPAPVWHGLLQFLQLDPWMPDRFDRHYASSRTTPLDDALREQLQAYFAPHNERLAELVGIDFNAPSLMPPADAAR